MTDETPPAHCAVVTGASSGIGRAAAALLLADGWRVIATGRDPARCAEAEAELRAVTPEARVDFLRGDFNEMADVRRIAGEIAALTDRVHLLVNNAGGVRDGFYRTGEGLEATFAANHLAPFVLTRGLLPLLERAAAETPPGTVRVIAVSSSAHRHSPGMRWDDLMMEKDFTAGAAYCQAKLANVLFTRELDRRLAGSGIVAQAMHPGIVGSNFASHGDQAMQAHMASAALDAPDVPARTIAWMATAPEAGLPGGRYFFAQSEEEPAPQGRDDHAATRLWDESERILERIA